MKSPLGRPRLFAEPEQLWKAACRYFQWCIDNPLPEVDFRGGAARKVTLWKIRVFTFQGLCRYLDCNTVWFNQFETSLKGREDETSLAFSKICTRIREIIYDQKFTAAAAGFLNPLMISRDLGLRERTEHTGADGGPITIQQITGMEIK